MWLGCHRYLHLNRWGGFLTFWLFFLANGIFQTWSDNTDIKRGARHTLWSILLDFFNRLSKLSADIICALLVFIDAKSTSTWFGALGALIPAERPSRNPCLARWVTLHSDFIHLSSSIGTCGRAIVAPLVTLLNAHIGQIAHTLRTIDLAIATAPRLESLLALLIVHESEFLRIGERSRFSCTSPVSSRLLTVKGKAFEVCGTVRCAIDAHSCVSFLAFGVTSIESDFLASIATGFFALASALCRAPATFRRGRLRGRSL